MVYIKHLYIQGYKKYHKKVRVDFNQGTTIIIGDNESGKTTIIEALDIVLNKKYFSYSDRNIYDEMFNINQIGNISSVKSIDQLPKINIELVFGVDDEESLDDDYFGPYYNLVESTDQLYGIRFEFAPNPEDKNLINELIKNGMDRIPIDYYKSEWKTFKGESYNIFKKPLKTYLIDHSNGVRDVFSNFARKLFDIDLPNDAKKTLGSSLRRSLGTFASDNKSILDIDGSKYSIAINDRKTSIRDIITVKDNSYGVSLDSMGKGKEMFVRTDIALSHDSDAIIIEEPENHLSHTRLRDLVTRIESKGAGRQVIITTHSPYIVNRLGLKKVIWVNDSSTKSLSSLPTKTEKYFKKLDNVNILQFVLSSKVVLVEGASEYIILPCLYKKEVESNLIDIISGGGVTFDHYFSLSTSVGNKVLAITDSDCKKQPEKIKSLEKIEKSLKANHFLSYDKDSFTFEVALYKKNIDLLKDFAHSNANDEYEGVKYDRSQAYMLNNKTESAYRISENFCDCLKAPDYIDKGMKWLIEK